MPLVLPHRTLEALSQAKSPEDFQDMVFNRIDLPKVAVMLNRVLTAVYIGSEKTAGGIIKPMSAVGEDVYQGKIALVLKVGPAAFKDDDRTSFYGQGVTAGCWVSFRIGNSSQIEINNVPCRLVTDDKIEMVFTDPRMVTS